MTVAKSKTILPHHSSDLLSQVEQPLRVSSFISLSSSFFFFFNKITPPFLISLSLYLCDIQFISIWGFQFLSIWGKKGRGVAWDFRLSLNSTVTFFEIQMGELDLDHCSRYGPMPVLIGPIIIKILKLK